jgi:hypothetical protein
MMTQNRFIWRLLIAVLVLATSGLVIGGDQAEMPRSRLKLNQQKIITQSILCTTPGIPDIVLVGLSGHIPKGKPGETYEVSVFIENRGQCETGNFRLQVSVLAQENINAQNSKTETRVIFDKFMPSLQPSRDDFSSYTKISVPFTTGPYWASSYDFSVVVDPDNKIKEFRENNNLIDRGMVINVSAPN